MTAKRSYSICAGFSLAGPFSLTRASTNERSGAGKEGRQRSRLGRTLDYKTVGFCSLFSKTVLQDPKHRRDTSCEARRSGRMLSALPPQNRRGSKKSPFLPSLQLNLSFDHYRARARCQLDKIRAVLQSKRNTFA